MTPSVIITTNIGPPQGTFLSPFLFTLYTSDCRYSSASSHSQTFYDDSALVGYITKNDNAADQNEVDSPVSWCDDAHHILNIDKTKELIFDFKRKNNK